MGWCGILCFTQPEYLVTIAPADPGENEQQHWDQRKPPVASQARFLWLNRDGGSKRCAHFQGGFEFFYRLIALGGGQRHGLMDGVAQRWGNGRVDLAGTG
jgi:hypothetical protein